MSFGLVLSLIFIAYILSKKHLASSEGIRKMIHIGVSNWWFVLVSFFDTIEWQLFGPIIFTIVNAIATFTDLTRYIGLQERIRNYGLIYFPISLSIMVLLVHYNIVPQCSTGMAILIMGYGDGFAAIFGKAYGKRKLHKITGKKTIVGTTTMFVVSCAVMYFFHYLYGLEWRLSVRGIKCCISTALIATILEAITPFGLDNLTVPIGVALWTSRLYK